MRILHRFGDIAHRSTIGHHNVNIDAKPLCMQPLGIGNAMCAIKEIAGRLRVQHCAAIGCNRIARRQ